MYNGKVPLLLQLLGNFFPVFHAPQSEPSPRVALLGPPEYPQGLVLVLAGGVLVHPFAVPVVYRPHGQSSVFRCPLSVLSLILQSRSSMRSSLEATFSFRESTAFRSPSTAISKPNPISTIPKFSMLRLFFAVCLYLLCFLLPVPHGYPRGDPAVVLREAGRDCPVAELGVFFRHPSGRRHACLCAHSPAECL